MDKRQWVVQIGIKIQPDLLQKVMTIAQDSESQSELVRNAIEQFLKNYDERQKLDPDNTARRASGRLVLFSPYVRIEQLDRLDEIAEKEGVSRSFLIRKAISEYIKEE